MRRAALGLLVVLQLFGCGGRVAGERGDVEVLTEDATPPPADTKPDVHDAEVPAAAPLRVLSEGTRQIDDVQLTANHVAFHARDFDSEYGIYSVAKAGGPVIRLASLGSKRVLALTTDAAHVYYVHDASCCGLYGTLFRIPVGGGEPVALAYTVSAGPIAVNATSIFWTASAQMELMRADLDGENARKLSDIDGLAELRATDEHLLWKVWSRARKVYELVRTDLDGRGAVTLWDAAPSASSTAFAVAGGRVAVITCDPSTPACAVDSVDVATGAKRSLFSWASTVSRQDIALDTTRAYFFGDDTELRAVSPAEPGRVTTIYRWKRNADALAVDETRLFWVDMNDETGRLFALDK